MTIRHLLLTLFLVTGAAHAEQRLLDEDGFKNPIQYLHFNPGLDQHEFERATFKALDVYDPWEPVNRRIYHFNYRLDEWVLLPTVRGYERVTPRFVRSGVTNFFRNLGDVTNLTNSLLQLKVRRSMNTTARLIFNTTFGVFGLWDPATLMGLPRQSEDFGQTLGYWGLPSGPYVMLPIFGPSNLRDTAGITSDFFAESQIDFLNVATATGNHPEIILVRGIDTRYNTSLRYGQLNSPFEYEKIRYVYTKSRDLQIAE
ncbi:MlaA family lipoprotein [Pseudomonas matsuisoli]|uniref:ABC transporter n=1 Tax=Pseudomonas matsuisoli TaxID=1515666 RepID=A0A917PT74_9PSED|nr:VacJ family lipoprotein [Pseudomonas matsuisoli]GGJ91073.1 ABC transporter [Pseudomonas matsuisoli]